MITWMQTHRKYLVPTIWISTIAFVGAGFVGWGAYDYGNNKSDTVAIVGDKEITVSELQSTYSNIFAYYNQMFGGKLTQEKAEQLHLQDIALHKLTNDALLLNYASELGITALDSEVIKEYTSIKAFQENGVFNKEKYAQILRAQGINQKTFEHNLEKGVILKKLQTALQLPATTLEDEAVFSATSLLDHLVIKKISEPADKIKLDDAELKAAWEKDKSAYMTPIAYTLETIKVSTDGIEVSDEEISAYYDEKKYKFKDQDGKILPLEKAKEEVSKAAKLKKAKSLILKKYLAFKKGEISAEEEMVVDASSKSFPFMLLKESKEGSYLKAIPVEDGYLTAKVKSITPPHPLSFEAAKEQVAQKLRKQKAIALLEERAKKESQSITDGEDVGFIGLSDAAKLTQLQPAEASQFLRYVFSKNDKSGYFISGESATLYNIKAQKLFDKEKFDKEKEDISKRVTNIKGNVLEDGLINTLKKKYKIQSFMKKEG
jgi:peptidyl-prolyl cis-trans isomerase D